MGTKDKKGGRRKRHLFYVCFEDLTQEGAWTVHIREVVDNWERLGVRVTLFAPGIWPFSVRPACDVVYVPTINVRIVREYLYLIVVALYILLFGLRRRPAAVYCREMSLITPIACCARLLGAPVVMEINGFILRDLRMIGVSRAKLAVFKLFEWVNLKVADSLVFAGKNYLRLFRKEYRIDERKVRFVPNGVDTGLFSPGNKTDAARQLGLDIKKRYITFVGTFYPHSLTPVIVRAARIVVTKHADIDFVMVGEGHDLARCKDLAEELGIAGRVLFPGMKKNRDIPVYLRASTILIDLTVDGSESATMKLLEYMSSGGTVIGNSTSAFGLPLTHKKDYYRIERATPGQLAGAIETLAYDESLTAEIGKSARDLVIDNFSWEKTAAKLLAVVDEVCDDR
ncbi:MAG: glycosyltransferase family 4 protein [Deltaproteobacteria bacterium]|nr:glycosyltransferase family 4 protein [Candidatus Zymogenaceae bacterium]